MILLLDKAIIREAGGKARGLAQLIQMDMNVPKGIVLIPEDENQWKTELESFLELPFYTNVAIRSSAIAEDSESASFAGQFESFLNCRGKIAIIAAVERCIHSAEKKRVESYQEHFHIKGGHYIPVIIQEMVDATKSGVLFTANPVNHRTDEWLINATTGLADDLMAGAISGEQILLSRNGRIIQKGKLLSENEIIELYQQAKRINGYFQKPMDLEWAYDKNGKLFWLQARPITSLKQVHINELDGELFTDDEIFTRANIGEMMPGPVTPLTYSVFGRAIEVGLQDFYIASGAQKAFTSEWLYFRMFYNHLFFSMTRLYDISKYVLLNKKKNLEFAIMGETLDDGRKIVPKSLPVRIRGQIKQFRYLVSGVKRTKKLEVLAEEFLIRETQDPRALYRELDKSRDILNEAYAHHYCASSQSGTYQTTLLSILSGGKDQPDREHYRDVAYLMANLNNVESADVIHTIDRLYGKYKNHPEIEDWLQSLERPGIGIEVFNSRDQKNFHNLNEFHIQLKKLLERQGHRGIREGELREKSWEEDPGQLFNLILKRFRAGDYVANRQKTYKENQDRIISDLGRIKGLILKSILPKARAAVARREHTKSLAIRIQHKIKMGYNRLAELMVKGNYLYDTDQIFFLTHQELGKCLESGEAYWKKIAAERRSIFPELFKIQFPVVSIGFPEPLPQKTEKIRINGNALKGLPVSAGTIKSKIRVIGNLKDANQLKKGEIMVCQYTDVGWTPYFSLAAGLITEIGSPLSHGAVVAREYGIPAVVNAKGALDFFKTGEKVLLDGGSGVILKLS